MRPRRVVAIAWRDLRNDLKGRRALFVPGVLVALLLPLSTIKREPGPVVEHVFGDVPPEVAARSEVQVIVEGMGRGIRFEERDDALVLRGSNLSEGVRQTLDATRPRGAVAVVSRAPREQAPHRGLLLALIGASSLTGPIASSIGSERSRGTLGALLTAAVTRAEIVAGKWLAWGGFALVSTLAFTAVALWREVVPPGWWVAALAMVPLGLTALGLWVVRRASDVVGATATALRLQPAALMTTGLLAYILGGIDPHLGAMVPLGGALVASGDVWVDATTTAPLVATVSTAAASIALLYLTAIDLDETVPRAPLAAGWTGAVTAAAAGALVCWTPLLGPELWRQAGNAQLTEALSPSAGALGAAAGLAGWGLLRAAGHALPLRTLFDLRRPSPTALATALLGGVGLAVASSGFAAFFDPTTVLGALSTRSAAALLPAGLPVLPGLVLLLAEELLFRGILAKQVGVAPASTAWAVVKAPLDPFAALVGGLTLGGASALGGLGAALLARLTAWSVALLLPSLPSAFAWGLGLIAAAACAGMAARTIRRAEPATS
jgi:hypothetical protein